VRRLCLSKRSSLHKEANSVEYVVFDWFMLIGASISRSSFISYSSYNVWNGALLLPELRPQVCRLVRRGLASVTPIGDPGAFV